MSQSKTENISLVYDGPALSQGVIDINELASSLVGIAKFLKDSNSIVNGQKSEINVNVKLRKGSIGIDLSLVQSFYENAVSMLAGSEATALANLLALTGFGGGAIGLIQFMQKAKGRSVEGVSESKTGKITVTLTGGEVIEIDEEVLRLFESRDVRFSLEQILKPLEMDGVDSFCVKEGESQKVYIPNSEFDYFKADSKDELLVEREYEQHLIIESVSFREGAKFKFSDGNSTFFAKITDEKYLEKVRKRDVVFGSNDMIKAKILMIQKKTPKGLRTDYEILEVLEHQPGAKQEDLI